MKEKDEENCIFCKIIKGEIPCFKIYEDDYVLSFLDIAKNTFGHTLVVPKKHFVNILDCDEFYLQKVFESVKKICNHFVKDCGFKAVNIINANGEQAGQSVFHFHIHILPKMKKEDFNAWPKFKGTDIELKDQQQKLKLFF